ncbi:MAG: CRISPR-associated protein Cas4 [Saprospiraceae bacterium]|nr:CRISPR-associated protein Cas4 [Saprospiraceae bacterium]
MISLTPSHIIEYLYCPRYTYFEYVLRIPQQEEKYYKVQRGRDLHLQRARQNVAYLRKRIGVVDKKLDQYLTNDLLRGEVDEVLWLKDGSMAPLDYKFAEYKNRVFETYLTQLYCYSWLIAKNFNKPVNRGFLVYTRSKNKLIELQINSNHIAQVKKASKEIQEILIKNKFPKATKYKRRCVNCTYRNVCVK